MFHQFNVIGQWEFRPHWLAEAGYVGTRGRNLLVVQNIGNSTGGFPGSRLVTTHGTVQAIQYIGKSWYNSLQTKVERRFTGGLSVLSTYVFSKRLITHQVTSALVVLAQQRAAFRTRFNRK
jgi:hypothetical protein